MANITKGDEINKNSKNEVLVNSPFNESSKTLLIDHKLFAFHIKHMIEREGFVFSKYNLRMAWGNASTNSTHINSLGSALRPNPANKNT